MHFIFFLFIYKYLYLCLIKLMAFLVLDHHLNQIREFRWHPCIFLVTYMRCVFSLFTNQGPAGGIYIKNNNIMINPD